MKKVLVAMSGGVDSSAAVICLKNMGHDVSGATMVMYDETCSGVLSAPDGAADARAAAERLGIGFDVIDARADFEREVMDSFVASYLAGETPNPCIVCNNKLKFGMFAEWAAQRGFDCIATGHYASVEKSGERWLLRRGKDDKKDQSYVLWSLSQDVLSKLILPLGALSKTEVRELAAGAALENASKKESQDICFIPDGDYAGFIERRLGGPCTCGRFVSQTGELIGEHKGLIRYTIGQHKKLGIGSHIPYYVLAKNAEKNEIVLGSNEDLFTREVRAREMNWIACDVPTAPLKVKAKIRYRHSEQSATVYAEEGGRATVVFDEAQRAVTPGQSIVLYDGDIVVGGGIITG